MSRIGKLPIAVPSGVTITVDHESITVAGPKGTLSQPLLEGVKVEQKDAEVIVTRQSDEPKHRAKHGLMRTLIANMVHGVTKGFEKKLELSGVGFRVNLAGSDLKFNLGYSHEIVYSLPQGITASVDQNTVSVSGIDKQQVGQTAAEIRALRKPEPYKGKGITYAGERIIRKSGKSGKEAA
jgi:large subunit ribosomal protein L6